jgi:hypothetical protein
MYLFVLQGKKAYDINYDANYLAFLEIAPTKADCRSFCFGAVAVDQGKYVPGLGVEDCASIVMQVMARILYMQVTARTLHIDHGRKSQVIAVVAPWTALINMVC